MKKMAIRKFLLINLLTALFLTTTITAIGNYYLDQEDIQAHLDSLMAISTLSYNALLKNRNESASLSSIQHNLNHIPDKLDRIYHTQNINRSVDLDLDKFNLQIWSPKNHLLLHSAEAEKLPLKTELTNGFSDKEIEGEKWRIFSHLDPLSGIRTVLAERYDSRNDLGHRIALDDIYIMLLMFPLSGLLIWFIIGRGLSSLERVATEVADRAPTHLEPVDIADVPLEIKPVIEELNQLFLRLQQAFDREKRFAADAAHELKTPLAAMKTQAQVAMKTLVQEEQHIAIKNVIAAVNRSTHIVQQLLTLSRLMPEDTHIHDVADFDIASLATETLAQLVPSALKKQIELSLDSPPQKIVMAGNATAIGVLIRNLVDNAIRYTPEHGNVHVTLSANKTHITLAVCDDGPGIPAALRQRVFERFFRVLGNKSPGSGLGLSIVQQIAKLHHAELTLGAPEHGQGLEVTVVFHRYLPGHAVAKSNQPS